MSRPLQARPRSRDIDFTLDFRTFQYEDLLVFLNEKPHATVAVRVDARGADRARWRIYAMLRYHLGAKSKGFSISKTKDPRMILVKRRKK